MRGISLEMAVPVLFIVAWLVRWTVGRMRGGRMRGPGGAARPLPPAPPVRFNAAPPRPASATGMMATVLDRPSRAQVRAGKSNRFSRAALLGDRRAVRDAMVAAIILGPCHARRRR